MNRWAGGVARSRFGAEGTGEDGGEDFFLAEESESPWGDTGAEEAELLAAEAESSDESHAMVEHNGWMRKNSGMRRSVFIGVGGVERAHGGRSGRV